MIQSEELLELEGDNWLIRLWLERKYGVPNTEEIYNKIKVILSVAQPREKILDQLAALPNVNAVQVSQFTKVNEVKIMQGTVRYLVPFDEEKQ